MLAQNQHVFKKPQIVQLDTLHTSSGYRGTEDGRRRSRSVLDRGGLFCLGTGRVLRSTHCLWIITGYTDFREIGRLVE